MVSDNARWQLEANVRTYRGKIGKIFTFSPFFLTGKVGVADNTGTPETFIPPVKYVLWFVHFLRRCDGSGISDANDSQ